MKRYDFIREIDGSHIEEDPYGEWVKWEDIMSSSLNLESDRYLAAMIVQDAKRYRWLAKKFGEGKETNIGEFITSKQDLDEYIDNKMVDSLVLQPKAFLLN